MTYFDNAATTFPKPEAVYLACDQFLRSAANPGRGGHRRSLDSTRLIFEARQSIAAFFGIKQVQRLVFTPGCTYSLNAALKGLALKTGDLVVTTSAEHNSVMRPLAQLKRDVGIKVQQLPYCPDRLFNRDDLKNVLSENKIRLCVLNHASTGPPNYEPQKNYRHPKVSSKFSYPYGFQLLRIDVAQLATGNLSFKLSLL
jgi:selenocysteine lyase/cysteine desulfurase